MSRDRRQEAVELAGDPELLFCDGLDEAIVGVVEHYAERGRQTRVLYDEEKCIEILARDSDRESAVEFYEFNIIDSHVGRYTPAFARFLPVQGEAP